MKLLIFYFFFDINVWGLGYILYILHIPVWTSHISGIATRTGPHGRVGDEQFHVAIVKRAAELY